MERELREDKSGEAEAEDAANSDDPGDYFVGLEVDEEEEEDAKSERNPGALPEGIHD